MADFNKRDRPGGFRQRFVRVQSLPFEGTKILQHREGGNKPLAVLETGEGIFLLSWMIESDVCRKFLREMRNSGRAVVLSLVVDTNVPGHPTVSMQLQEIIIDKD